MNKNKRKEAGLIGPFKTFSVAGDRTCGQTYEQITKVVYRST